jgi:hypothetical protein
VAMGVVRGGPVLESTPPPALSMRVCSRLCMDLLVQLLLQPCVAGWTYFWLRSAAEVWLPARAVLCCAVAGSFSSTGCICWLCRLGLMLDLLHLVPASAG